MCVGSNAAYYTPYLEPEVPGSPIRAPRPCHLSRRRSNGYLLLCRPSQKSWSSGCSMSSERHATLSQTTEKPKATVLITQHSKIQVAPLLGSFPPGHPDDTQEPDTYKGAELTNLMPRIQKSELLRGGFSRSAPMLGKTFLRANS